jgi:tetratricopeptide (TPR) repeat protein
MECAHETVSRRRHAETLVILAALVLMAYANSLGSGFTLDNRFLILNDARVHSVSEQHLRDILERGYWWPTVEGGLYRPLTTLSFLLNYAVLGDFDQPAGYHWVNLLLHVAAAFLVYMLALLLVRQYWPAFFAAALWALHPVATEAVTNIVGRADELAALGVLAALLLYVRAARETGRRRAFCLAAMMAAAAVAVFSKESGVVVLGVVVLYDLTWRIPRGGSPRELAGRLWQFFLQGYVYLALPVLAMLWARWAVLRRAGAMEIPFVDNPLSGADFLTGRANAIRVIGKYLWMLLYPRTLSINYSYNQIPVVNRHTAGWLDWAAGAAVVGLVLLAAVCYRRRPVAFFLLGFSALALLPVANLLFFTGTIMADRLLYLPSVGFAAAVAIGAYRLANRRGVRPMVAAAVLAAVGLAYAVRTYRRNADWQDDETLYTSAVEASPASFKTHQSLALTWFAKDPNFREGDRAIGEAEAAAAIVAGLPDNRNATSVFVALGGIYAARGDSLAPRDSTGAPTADAESALWYLKALSVDLQGVAVDRAANENHRRAELARGTPPEAIARVGMADLYANLGRVYLRLDDVQAALPAFLDQRSLAPGTPQVYDDLASAYTAQNRLEEAATALLESFILDGSPLMLSKVADLYGKLEGGSCAIARQPEGSSLNHDCPLVRRHLCNAYRDLMDAFQQAKRPDLAEGLRSRARDAGCQ